LRTANCNHNLDEIALIPLEWESNIVIMTWWSSFLFFTTPSHFAVKQAVLLLQFNHSLNFLGGVIGGGRNNNDDSSGGSREVVVLSKCITCFERNTKSK
jgi:hypothetical protein